MSWIRLVLAAALLAALPAAASAAPQGKVVIAQGVDPTTLSTDHSREYIPLLVFGPQVTANASLGVRKTFSDVAATLAELFALKLPEYGTSFVRELTVK